MGRISDRSREFSQKALATLNSILEKYPSCPNVSMMKEEERYWIKGKMNEFGNAIAGTKYRGFSFYKEAVKNIRNPNSHTVEEDIKLLETSVSNFFTWTNKAKIELAKNITKVYSQNNKIRRFEKYSSTFGSEENRKLFVDSLQSELLDEQME